MVEEGLKYGYYQREMIAEKRLMFSIEIFLFYTKINCLIIFIRLFWNKSLRFICTFLRKFIWISNKLFVVIFIFTKKKRTSNECTVIVIIYFEESLQNLYWKTWNSFQFQRKYKRQLIHSLKLNYFTPITNNLIWLLLFSKEMKQEYFFEEATQMRIGRRIRRIKS